MTHNVTGIGYSRRSHRPLKTLLSLAVAFMVAQPMTLSAEQKTAITSGVEAKYPSGQQIAERINARDEGVAVTRTLTMEMIKPNGKKRTRVTRGYRKYYGDEKRTVLFYDSPRNIKGTAFLTIDYPSDGQDDDQWIYLPAMRKVRRVSAADRGDYFLGTDFTYEDIKKETKVELKDYSRKTLREEMLDGHRCYVVESIPVDDATAKELGHSRMLSWVDADIWIVRKAEFWDTRGNPLKTTLIKEIEKVQNIWTPHRMEVENHKTGHKTIFSFSDIDYDSPVPEHVFTIQSLERGL